MKTNLAEIDEIISFNIDYAIYSFYDKVFAQNPNVRISRMEEGIISYNYTESVSCGKTIRIAHCFRKCPV